MFAHQGGWDEFLYVLAPILVIVMLLRVAGKRARKLGRQDPSDVTQPD